jgi:peptidyl-tRNA hydrolase, PTH1 family
MSSKKQPAAPPLEELPRVLVVGLGNPGPKYAETRHNIGFFVVDALARRNAVSLSGRRYDAELGEGRIAGKRVTLLKPQTFMNLSGKSVAQAVRYVGETTTGIPLDGGVVVVHDEVDLELGRVQVKWSGGTAGHNGLRSLEQYVGRHFFRLRVGVGRPRVGSVSDYVLSRFASHEWAAVRDVVDGGAEALERLLREGLLAAQNEFHGRRFGPAPAPDATTDRGAGTD